jgi:hypothetical protein
VCGEPGANRVVDDVAADRAELVLVLDLAAPEALAEQVAPPAVASVESLRVAAVELLEARGKLGDGRFDDEVVVVRHQAERVQAPVVLADDEAEQAEEGAAIVIVPVDRDPPGTPGSDVERAVREDVSRQSSHPCNVGTPPPARIVCGRTVTLLIQSPSPIQPCLGTVPSHGRRGDGRAGHGRGQSPDLGVLGMAGCWDGCRLSRVTA